MNTTSQFRAFAIFLLFLFSAPSLAQDSNRWRGELDVKVAKLRLEIQITFDEDGAPKATLFSLDQGNAEIPVEKLSINGDQIEMEMNSVGASYSGELNADHTECTGTFTQNGQEFPLVFKKVEAEQGDPAMAPKHIETWTGKMNAAGREFEFQLRVFEDSEGKKSAKLDSLSESVRDLRTEFDQSGDQFEFTVPLSGAKYQGALAEDGKSVEGKWIQGGGEFALNFTSVELAKTNKVSKKRPQTPVPPFPYDAMELEVENNEAKLTLAGTLTMPKGDGPFATMILISGSGPQDRDETILEHKPFAVLADHLTKAGIAVFRYDERGVGKSTGTYSGATSEDFAGDVEAIIMALKKQDKVDKKKIGLIGHSEGGLIAPMIAARNQDVAFIVMMAGPGVPGKQIILTQSRAIAKASGVPDEALDLNQKFLKQMLGGIANDATPEGLLNRVIENIKKELPEEAQDGFKLPDAAKAQMAMFETPWFRFFSEYDPVPALKKTKCPVLSVIGEKDLQVDCEMNQEAIEAALKAGNNKDYTISRLADLNHLFQKCETGSPTEYASIEETLNPVFLDLITNWLLKRVN